MKKGEIYLVNFPFSDLSITKKRPALLIGEITGNNKIFCQISTKLKLNKKYAVKLLKKYSKSDLKTDSIIYADMIFTLHKDLILRKIGKVDEKITKEVNLKLFEILLK